MIISVVFFLFLSLTVIAGLVSPTVRDYSTTRLNTDSKQAYYLTESGSEDFIYRTFKDQPVTSSEEVTIGGNSVTTSLSSDINGTYVESRGVLSDINRKVNVTLVVGNEASFNYGLQVGLGGVSLQSSNILGNIYSNGPITGDSSSNITGTAIAASSAASNVDQSNGVGIPNYDRSFGNANSTQDIAQGFKVSSDDPLDKASFYIKKFGTPPDATVKIVSDLAGSPSSTVLASGTLSSLSVTNTYNWVDVDFSTSPTLVPGTQYWLIIDSAASSGSRYYIIGGSDPSLQGQYANGIPKAGQFGVSWSNPWLVDFDYYFKIYLGGVTGLIEGSSGSQWNQLHIGTVSGTAQAHTVNYVNSTGLIYCKEGKGNNQSCTDQTDPLYQSFPIPDSYIDDWKSVAAAGGTFNGNYTVGSSGDALGPLKINGNLTVSGGGTLTINGTIWVTGNISISGGASINLSSSYGSLDGLVVADGNISITGGAQANGSGIPESYIMLLTTSSSGSAISISGGSGAVILYARDGTLNVSGGAELKSATAYRVVVSGGSDLIYESGLANVQFTSGALAGGFSIGGWKEIQ